MHATIFLSPHKHPQASGMISMLTVKDVMVEKVVTIQSGQAVQLAARTMGEHGIGCLVVLEDGRVVGMVTERDLLDRVLVVAVDPGKNTR